jgi:hypothetical protein
LSSAQPARIRNQFPNVHLLALITNVHLLALCLLRLVEAAVVSMGACSYGQRLAHFQVLLRGCGQALLEASSNASSNVSSNVCVLQPAIHLCVIHAFCLVVPYVFHQSYRWHGRNIDQIERGTEDQGIH